MTSSLLRLRILTLLLAALWGGAQAEELLSPDPPVVITPDAGGIDDYGLE